MKLRILTPLYIGSGEFVLPSSYLLEGNNVFIFDFKGLWEGLGAHAGEYFQWLSASGRNRSLNNFLKEQGLSPSLLLGKKLYTLPLRQEPKERIYTFIKLPGRPPRPYIPATEIKGFLRTAILYRLLTENAEGSLDWLKDKLGNLLPLANKVEALEKELKGGKPKKRELRKKRSELAQNVKNISTSLEERLLRSEKGSLVDALRFLHLADSNPLPADKLCLRKVWVRFGTGEERGMAGRIDKGAEGKVRFGTEKERGWWYEVLAPEASPIEFEVKSGSFSPWGKKAEEYLQMPVKRSEWGFIKESAFIFSRDILAEEGDQELSSQNTPKNPLLRLGMHKGFLATSLGLILREMELISVVSSLYTKKSRKKPFPATRKFVKEEGKEIGLGWVRLED